MNTIFVLSEQSIADIVTQNFKAADVFRNYKIDFCCGGKMLLADVCKQKQLSLETILKELNKSENTNNENNIRFDTWSSALLINFIIENHHAYIIHAAPLLLELSTKVARVHGESYSELQATVHELISELIAHLRKEEQELFPSLQLRETSGAANLMLETLSTEIYDEHTKAGELMHTIRELTNDYTLPVDACNSHRILYQYLEDFEHDLHLHVHLENNILMPRL